MYAQDAQSVPSVDGRSEPLRFNRPASVVIELLRWFVQACICKSWSAAATRPWWPLPISTLVTDSRSRSRSSVRTHLGLFECCVSLGGTHLARSPTDASELADTVWHLGGRWRRASPHAALLAALADTHAASPDALSGHDLRTLELLVYREDPTLLAAFAKSRGVVGEPDSATTHAVFCVCSDEPIVLLCADGWLMRCFEELLDRESALLKERCAAYAQPYIQQVCRLGLSCVASLVTHSP